jgi:hypothetical protein
MRIIILALALALELMLTACNETPQDRGDPVTGGFNCSVDARKCEPGQRP